MTGKCAARTAGGATVAAPAQRRAPALGTASSHLLLSCIRQQHWAIQQRAWAAFGRQQLCSSVATPGYFLLGCWRWQTSLSCRNQAAASVLF